VLRGMQEHTLAVFCVDAMPGARAEGACAHAVWCAGMHACHVPCWRVLCHMCGAEVATGTAAVGGRGEGAEAVTGANAWPSVGGSAWMSAWLSALGKTLRGASPVQLK